MTEKDLKNLSRTDLIKLLQKQMKINEKMKVRVAELETELEDRHIAVKRCGSLAAAALEINHVFEAADAAARQYIENVKELTDGNSGIVERAEKEAKAKADELIARTEKLCREKLEAADRSCHDWREKTIEECRAKEAEADRKYAEAEKYWALAAKQAAKFGVLPDDKK